MDPGEPLLASLPVVLGDVQDAAARLSGVAHVTPVLTSSYLDSISGFCLFFKCENLQRGGAFKFRGAYNSVSRLASDVQCVVTQSSGNHAQALALSAKLCGKQAHIVMPRNAPACKLAAVRDYGGHITLCEPTQASRESTADALMKSLPSAALIPPFDYDHVIAGQGTVGLEILQQLTDIDAIIAPVGGGGLISGICVAAKSLKPSIKVFAAEPALASDAFHSLQNGVRTPLPGPTSTIADGLRTQLIGEKTFAIMKALLDEIFLVSEEEIVAATRTLWERMKMVVEPSGAVPLAAVLSPAFKARAAAAGVRRVCVVLSGGNQDMDAIPWVAQKH